MNNVFDMHGSDGTKELGIQKWASRALELLLPLLVLLLPFFVLLLLTTVAATEAAAAVSAAAASGQDRGWMFIFRGPIDPRAHF